METNFDRRRVGNTAAPLPIRRQSSASVGNESLFAGLDWSISYVAFLVYIFVITTYRLPLGTASMTVALIALPMERTPLRIPPVAAWTIALLGWAFLGWVTTNYPAVVWDKTVEFAKICGVVLVAVNVLTSRARLRFFLLAFLGFFAFYPVRGTLFSYFIYGGTVQGRAAWNYAYSNPNDLAADCLLVLSLAAGMLFTERKRWIRACAVAGVIVLPFVILLTQSRGAFIALTVLGLVVLKGQKARRGKILVVLATIGVIVAAVAPDSLWERIGTISQVTNEQSAAKANDEGSARQRLEIWKVARTIIAEHPLIGVGMGAYPDAHYVYSQRQEFNPIALGHRDTHSTYLNIMAETGVVGFVFFLMILIAAAVDAERTRRRAKLVHPSRAAQLLYMNIGLLGFLIAGIWGSYDQLVITYLYLALMQVTTSLLKADLTPATPRRMKTSRAAGSPGYAQPPMRPAAS